MCGSVCGSSFMVSGRGRGGGLRTSLVHGIYRSGIRRKRLVRRLLLLRGDGSLVREHENLGDRVRAQLRRFIGGGGV